MKRIAARLVVIICIITMMTGNVFAINEHGNSSKNIVESIPYVLQDDIFLIEGKNDRCVVADYGVLDQYAKQGEHVAKFYHDTYGKELVWAVYSLNSHQNVETRFFKQGEYEKFKETLSDNVDFVQMGTFVKLTSSDQVKNTQQQFRDDSITAALNAIMPFGSDIEEVRKNIVENHLPIYWRVETAQWDENYGIIEVAVGKYQIQSGDTLSQIAEKFDTSVNRLLEYNRNIENPDVIYEGDYLVVK